MLKDSNIPAQEVLRIARTLILARVAQAKGDYRTAVVRFERGGRVAGRAALHRAALLVLPDPAVARRRPAAGRPLCRGGATVPARAQPRASQWLVLLWAGQLYKARGNTAAARKAEADLAKTWIGDRKLLQISNL